MHIRCPHCHSPIEVVKEASFTDICCPSCGSSFSLIDGDTTETFRTGNRSLAHFQLVRELGIGKFGSVWMAHDTKLDRTVAIKIPRKGSLTTEETEAFLRDARAAAQLKHPNIASVHEVGREQGTVYIVSDYIEGANLREWLSTRKPSFRESAELVVTLASAIHHAHESGVVHRDLKPSNIMLDEEGRPHVIDFGLAKRDAGEITMTIDGQILGTPAYMSPEQARGEGHNADARSDVYSLGVILFELLTGELPFRGETEVLLVQIRRDEPRRLRKLNARIPRDLETITLKCLEKDPARRFQTAQSLANDLQSWLDGRPISARAAGVLDRCRRWARRNPAIAGLSLMVFALAVTVGIASHQITSRGSIQSELTPDEIRLLQNRAAFLQHSAKPLKSDSKAPQLEQCKNAYELASITAVLASIQRGPQAAIQSLYEAVSHAQAGHRLAYNAFFDQEDGRTSPMQLAASREELAMAELARERLTRSIAGEQTNWFRIAMDAGRRTARNRLNIIAPPSMDASPISAREIEILDAWVAVHDSTFRIISANVDHGNKGHTSIDLFISGLNLYAVRAQREYRMRHFSQAIADQKQAVEYASKWLAAAKDDHAASSTDSSTNRRLIQLSRPAA